MQIKLGETIRRLRKRDNRTQEHLASALGVSNQAVSRWEANGGYPDIEILPAIANYFHVTIDELFGYNGDREEKLNRIIMEYSALLANRSGDELDDCVDKLADALEEFPNEPNISLLLVSALLRMIAGKGDITLEETDGSERYKRIDRNRCCKSERIDRALHLIENTDITSLPHVVRDNVVSLLAVLYYSIGEYNAVRKLADKSSAVAVSREVLLSWSGDGEKRAECLGYAIIKLLDRLSYLCVLAVGSDSSVSTDKYALEIFEKLTDLYETLFCDGNFGSAHCQAISLYLSSAFTAAKMGDIERGVAYCEKSRDQLDKAMRLHDSEIISYTAPLFDKVTEYSVMVPPVTVIKDSWLLMLSKLPDDLRQVLKFDPRYTEYFDD